MTTAASLSNITVTTAARRIVNDITVNLHPGQLHALIGPSGGGKTTLGKLFTGTLPAGSQLSGMVTVAGHTLPPGHRNWRTLRGSTIAHLGQHPTATLTPTRRIGQLINEMRHLHHTTDTTTATGLLHAVHLDADVAQLYPHQLSGGMAARTALALALAGTPRILIADEPTAHLDPQHVHHIHTLLRRLADSGVAVLLISHNIAALDADGIADTATVIDTDHLITGTWNTVATNSHPVVTDLFHHRHLEGVAC